MILNTNGCYMLDISGQLFESNIFRNGRAIHPRYSLKNNIKIDECLWFIEHSDNKISTLLQKPERSEAENTEVFNYLRDNFCRVRTSCRNNTGIVTRSDSIYFRVPEFSETWFNLIWTLAGQIKEQYKYITIELDAYYNNGVGVLCTIKNTQVLELPIDEFLALK